MICDFSKVTLMSALACLIDDIGLFFNKELGALIYEGFK